MSGYTDNTRTCFIKVSPTNGRLPAASFTAAEHRRSSREKSVKEQSDLTQIPDSFGSFSLSMQRKRTIKAEPMINKVCFFVF